MRISFVVEGQPVPCARARVTRRGNFLPARVSGYERLVRDVALAAALDHPGGWEARADRYAITLRFFRADARRVDFDNLAKSVTDPLNKLLYPDDSHIKRALITVDVDRARPRVEVELEALEWQVTSTP